MSIPPLPPRNPTRLGKLRAAWIGRTQKGAESAWKRIMFGVLNNGLSFKQKLKLVEQARFLYDHNIPSKVGVWVMFQSLDTLVRLRYPRLESLTDKDEKKRERALLIKGMFEVFEMALAGGMNPNRQHTNNYWDYPVHKVASSGNRDLMEILIRHGADIDKKDGNGYTALGCALNSWGEFHGSPAERENTARLLIEHNTDLVTVKRNTHFNTNGESFYTTEPACLHTIPFPQLQLDVIKKGSPVHWDIVDYRLDSVLTIPGDNPPSTREHILFNNENLIWDWQAETRLREWLRELEKRSGRLSDLRSIRGWTPSMELLTNLPLLGLDQDKDLQNQPLVERLEKLQQLRVFEIMDKSSGGSNIWHALFSCLKKHSVELTAIILTNYPDTAQLLDEPNKGGVKPRHILDFYLSKRTDQLIRTDNGQLQCDLPAYGKSWDDTLQQLLSLTYRKQLMDIVEKIRPEEDQHYIPAKPKM